MIYERLLAELNRERNDVIQTEEKINQLREQLETLKSEENTLSKRCIELYGIICDMRLDPDTLMEKNDEELMASNSTFAESVNEYNSISEKLKMIQSDIIKLERQIDSFQEQDSKVFDLSYDEMVITDSECNVDMGEPINDDYIFHRTDKFPENNIIQNNFDGRKKLECTFEYRLEIKKKISYYSGRKTVHFTHNGIVTSNNGGDWTNKKVLVIDSYMPHKGEFTDDKIYPSDDWTWGSVQLSDDSIIFIDISLKGSVPKNIDTNKTKIVYYSGDVNKCLDNFFRITGLKKKEINYSDKRHFCSEYINVDRASESRSASLSFFNIDHDVDLSNIVIDDKILLMLIDFYVEGNGYRYINKYLSDNVIETMYKETGLLEIGVSTNDIEIIINTYLTLGFIKQGETFRYMTPEQLLDFNMKTSNLSQEDIARTMIDTDFLISLVKKYKVLKVKLDTLSRDEIMELVENGVSKEFKMLNSKKEEGPFVEMAEKFLSGDLRDATESIQR